MNYFMITFTKIKGYKSCFACSGVLIDLGWLWFLTILSGNWKMTDSNFKDSLKLFQYVYNGLVKYLFVWFIIICLTLLPFLASSNISVSKTNTQGKPGFLKVTICSKTENTPIRQTLG